MAFFTYDSDIHAIYMQLRQPEGGEREGRRMDERRIELVDHAGNVFGYELLFVDRGISLDGIPDEDAALIREAVESMRRLSFGESPPAVSAAS